MTDARDRLALALDVPDLDAATALATSVAPYFGIAKVGLELFSAAGPAAFTRLRALDLHVFADLKLHDIPTTVGRAARVLGGYGLTYLNFHAAGGVEMLRAGVEGLLAGAREGSYLAIQAFVDPAREGELAPLIERARRSGLVVTCGLGPRYLHSTGQLHKGGPPTGLFLQVVDDPGGELPIPGRKLGFRRLIRAQAAGDYAALKERGRPVARIRLEDL